MPGRVSAIGASIIVRLLTGLAVLLLGLDGGAYSLESRGMLAVAVWWAILLGAATGLLARRPTREAIVAGALLACFAALTLVSIAWAPGNEQAFAEGARVLLYLGLFVLAACSPPEWRPALVDGLAAGCTAVAGVALAGRCFPDSLPGGELAEFLPSAAARLAYPVGYWNGLAVVAALGVPLLLRAAVAATTIAARGLAVGAVPALACAVYLASSRGAAAAAVLGALAFLLLERRRWAAAGAVTVGAVGAAAAIAVLLPRGELVDGPLGSDTAAAQGRTAAVLLVLVCLATGLVHAVGLRLLSPPRLSGRLAWAAAAAGLALVVAGVAAVEPVEAFRTFKEPPGEFSQPRDDLVRAHLLSGGGSGRWQFWAAAADEFRARPLAGGGAGSYERWWAEHGGLAYFVRDAHSLYLETLAELGVAGLALLAVAFAAGLAGGLRSLRRAEPRRRTTIAALAAAFLAYAFAAGIDWMWETTVVSVVGIACLGLLVAGDGPRVRGGPVARACAAALAAVVVAMEAVPLLAATELERSRESVRRGDLEGGRAHALRARDVQAWAASPYLQLAFVAEEEGDLVAARARVGEALARDGSDWRLWLVASRLDTKAGAIGSARRSLARATELNPRSPLFANPRQ